MLQDVGRSPLIALIERGNHRFLFLPAPRVTNLEIALVLLLTNADVSQVCMILFTQAGKNRTTGAQRVVGRAQIVLELKQDIKRKPLQAGLDLIVQNEICIVEF